MRIALFLSGWTGLEQIAPQEIAQRPACFRRLLAKRPHKLFRLVMIARGEGRVS
jgi:hypothetical protein